MYWEKHQDAGAGDGRGGARWRRAVPRRCGSAASGCRPPRRRDGARPRRPAARSPSATAAQTWWPAVGEQPDQPLPEQRGVLGDHHPHERPRRVMRAAELDGDPASGRRAGWRSSRPDRPPCATRCGEPGQAAAAGRVRAAAAASSLTLQQRAVRPARSPDDRDLVRVAVLGRVGQQLGGAEVGDRLDRRGRRGPGWSVASSAGIALLGGQGGQRVGQAVVQYRRVDAPGQVAQLDQGVLGVPVGGVDQLAGSAALAVVVAELLPAMPRFMARVASRICAPSCRSRSSRRSSAAESSTASARVCSRSAHPLRRAGPGRAGRARASGRRPS